MNARIREILEESLAQAKRRVDDDEADVAYCKAALHDAEARRSSREELIAALEQALAE